MHKIFICKKCGLDGRYSPRGYTFGSDQPCSELVGTRFYDPREVSNPGPNWCPHMSDAAAEESVEIELLSAEDRVKVIAAIAAAKAKA
jgi:hypothetical protein